MGVTLGTAVPLCLLQQGVEACCALVFSPFHHGQPLLPPPSLLEENHFKPDRYTPPSLLQAEGDICFGSWGSTVEMVWQHREESPEEAGSLGCSSLWCLCRGAVVERPDEPEAVNELLTP